MVMSAVLEMDRPFEENIHYFSPGGFEVQSKTGEYIGFDFTSSKYEVGNEPNLIRFCVSDLDVNAFPDAPRLGTVFGKNLLDQFTEFFIYTGEKGDPACYPIKAKHVDIEFGGAKYSLADAQLQQINALLQRDKLDKIKENEYA